jgi:hypothetical protein
VPFDATDPYGLLTEWKLRPVLADKAQCMAQLEKLGAVFVAAENHEDSAQCHIRDRVELRDLGGAKISRLDTTCETALRTALWLTHSVAPTAVAQLGSPVSSVTHFGSFSCRQIRSSSGASGRMSQHATANAIDISGLTLADGRKITLKDHWESPEFGPFLSTIRNGGCDWFNMTLSPDYNALHADHFHFDMGVWRGCR